MRILLVEDDRQTAAYVAKGLTEEGHIVDTLSDGRDGLVQATSEPYDLVIVDLRRETDDVALLREVDVDAEALVLIERVAHFHRERLR